MAKDKDVTAKEAQPDTSPIGRVFNERGAQVQENDPNYAKYAEASTTTTGTGSSDGTGSSSGTTTGGSGSSGGGTTGTGSGSSGS